MITSEEKKESFLEYLPLFRRIYSGLEHSLSQDEIDKLRPIVKKTLANEVYGNHYNIGSIASASLHTLIIMIEEMQLKSVSLIAMIVFLPATNGIISLEKVKETFGSEVHQIVKGLKKVRSLQVEDSVLASENYINLLLSFAQDIRVILINIASKLYFMRIAKQFDDAYRTRLLARVAYLYTPLAHKLGLYSIKSEFEDLHLKYTDREAYDHVVQKISESKESRDKYVASFIAPIEKELKKTGLKYDIKGRIKSISSINNKLKKQNIEFEKVYDLFAIRIILKAELEKEKAECWQVYSIIADMYTPNPKRLKDWLSIPKSNGYESLHTTVMGPDSKWVEVQIRSERMDEIAERGLAAHWMYKGLKKESRLDDWLSGLREMLESSDLETDEKLENFRLDLYDDEIYVFTPKGDLHKLPYGASILDFAFSIHSNVGASCVSGKVNGRNVSIRHKLKNGDQIEIVTSPNQTPKQDWLNFVITSKAKNRIRHGLKEAASKQVDLSKEMLKRRLKNRKIDINESLMMRLVKKLGYKTLTEFYLAISNNSIDVNNFIDQYLELENKQNEIQDKGNITTVSAEKFVQRKATTGFKEESIAQEDELIIDQNLTGVEYSLAPCCNPIYGDKIFGYISTQGIKIHRQNCPNAPDMFSRFGYRVLPARWSGNSVSHYTVSLRVVGNDDIGIVNNLTSIISKEENVSMRSISIDSIDGLFQGNISVILRNKESLNGLIKKLQTVRGVKTVNRLN